MIIVVIFARRIGEKSERRHIRIDILSVILSAFGLIGVVFGMLQSKVWGWVVPLHSPEINGVEVAPLGISLSAWFIVLGIRAARRCSSVASGGSSTTGREPLVHVDLLSIRRLRSGLSVLGAQYAITAGLFFMVPVYLQMTLGLRRAADRDQDLPAVDLADPVLDRRHPAWHRAGRRGGSSASPSGSWWRARSCCSPRSIRELSGWAFGIGMFCAGAALGLLASQLGQRQHVVGDREGHERGRRPAGRLPEPRVVAGNRADRIVPDRRAGDVVRVRIGGELAARRRQDIGERARPRMASTSSPRRTSRRSPRMRASATTRPTSSPTVYVDVAARGAAHRVLRADRAGAAVAARLARHPERNRMPRPDGEDTPATAAAAPPASSTEPSTKGSPEPTT